MSNFKINIKLLLINNLGSVVIMGYNIIDIINKVINIAIRRKTIFQNIGQSKCDIPSINIMSKVLVKQIDKTIHYLETLKKEIGNTQFEEIDFVIYDKMSFLINEFNKKLFVPEINSVRQYLRFSIDLEKDTHSLLIDIQGRFVKSTSDIHTKTYKILSDIIDNIDKHITTLEEALK
jgi:hypothetical protein